MTASWQISEKYAWNDGRPLTGYDIAFTLEQLHASGKLAALPEIKVDRKNPSRFTLGFQSIRPDHSQILAFSILPRSKKRLIEKLADTPDTKSVIAFSSGLYYGPYQVSELQRG